MANRRKPPRKSSQQKNRDPQQKQQGGNRGHQGGGNQGKRRPDQGRQSTRQQQQTVASKITQTMRELPQTGEPPRSSSVLVKLAGFASVALILFFGYFILMEYLDKTPVYGKHGWDDIAGQPATWEEAVEYCSAKRKRLPDREELKTFSKRADKKLKAVGIFWSTTPEGDNGNFQTVNLSTGEFGSSPTNLKFAAICVK